MESITVPKKIFTKILADVEVLIDDVEIALDSKVRKRVEDIKTGKPTRDKYIENYKTTLKNLGEAGIPVVCYNFMPVFDWTRSDLAYPLPDGSNALIFDEEQVNKMDPRTLSLPGWDESYTSEEMNNLMEFSLNAKEIRPMDVLKVKLAKTTSEMKTALENSWTQIQKVSMESQQRDIQAQQQMQQQQLQQQLQIQAQNREDVQAAKINEINTKTQGQIVIDDNKAKNKMYENHLKSQSEIINTDHSQTL